MTKTQKSLLQPMTISPKTYFIKTFGCQMNESDSERIASFLEKNNFKPAENIEQANLVIFNTCGVRQTAEDRVYGQVHNLRKQNKNCIIVITGCLAHRKDVQRKLKEKADLFIQINKLFDLPLFKEELREILSNYYHRKNLSTNSHLKKEGNAKYLSTQPKYKNNNSAFVPIMTGCNNFCTYCVVPYARGREYSRPPKDIFKEIENLAKDGCKKITLLGQNVNSYKYLISNSKLLIGKYKKITNYIGKEISFPILINFLANNFPNIKFNFLTSHPKDFSDKLIEAIAENKNISREIHLPVQSGSNKILKKMNRPYTQKKYLNLISKIKKNIPDVKFSTDVIVGFPGETEKDFQETVKVFKKIDFFEAYINKYSPRPETAAYKLEDKIPWEEKKKREKILRKFIKKP